MKRNEGTPDAMRRRWKSGARQVHPPSKLNRRDPWRNPQVLSDGLSDGNEQYEQRAVLPARTDSRDRYTSAHGHFSNVVKNSRTIDAGGSRPGGLGP